MRRVVITGVGLITPIGTGIEEFWASLQEGKSGISKIERFPTDGYSTRIAGEVKNFDPFSYMSPKDAKRTDRFTQFAIAAAKLAIEDSQLPIEKIPPDKIGVYIGSGIGGLETLEREHKVLLEKGPSRVSPFLIPMLIPNIAAGMVSILFNSKGPNLAHVSACASANHAIGDAFNIMRCGYADVMLAGGAEACITPLGLAGFCSMRALSTKNDTPELACRPFDRERDGFVMAEGASIVVLEEFNFAKSRGAPIRAEIIGYGLSSDAYHITQPDPSGEGARLAMVAALKDAKISKEEVGYINAHGTSTKLNDIVETYAIKAVFGDFAYKIPISSTKSMHGHLLGAAGAVELASCLLALQKSIIPPTINYQYPDPECDLFYVPNEAIEKEVNVCLSNAFGFGGQNATLILRKII